MLKKIIAIHKSKTGTGADEDEKMDRLVRAESELSSLKARAARAIKKLDDRQGRNHWRESIEQMIQGSL